MAESTVLVAYEFTPEQNQGLLRLITRMRWVWTGMLVGGGLEFLLGMRLISRWGQLHDGSELFLSLMGAAIFSGIVLVLSGLYLRSACSAFTRIVATEGSDVDHLMQALESLANFFLTSLVLSWLLILGLFVALVKVRMMMPLFL